jgi:hypothetical protein
LRLQQTRTATAATGTETVPKAGHTASSAPGPHLRGPVRMLRTSASALLAPAHARPVRMLSATASSGTIPIYSVTPLSELLQRVRMAEVHSSFSVFHAEPAGA